MIIDPNNKLNDLNDWSKPIFTEFLLKVQAIGYDVRINGTYYSYADSVKLHENDSRNPIWNFHEFGIAVDMNIINVDTGRMYKKSDIIDDWIHTGVPAIAEELGIRWGGLFNGYPDCIHFDLASKLGDNPYIVLCKLKELGEGKENELNKLDLSKL
jgi:hypothetical protein